MSRVGANFFRRSLNKSSLYSLICQRNLTLTKVTSSQYQTMQDIRVKLIKRLESDTQYTTVPKSREHLNKYLPKTQEELPVRKMRDSFDSAIVPLSSDAELKDKYTTFLGSVRFGRLMEDMDMFAVWCCVKHLHKPGVPFPYIIVTIRIDDIYLLDNINQPIADIRLSGHVCWVGKSSLEVVIWLDQQVNGKWVQIMRALLLMAARNPTNTGPGIVNGIEAETPEEKELLRGGEERKKRRQQMMQQSLLKTVPTEEELNLIHSLFIRTIDSNNLFLDQRILPPQSKWMSDCTMNNLVFCHPEHRNLHNKIFGGFLIRQALELSWIVAYYQGTRIPKLIHISDISFYHPVDVGSLLQLNASVTFTEDEYLQVFVYAVAFNHSNIKGESTTSFNFTYKLDKKATQVYPSTYLEAMKYIDGRRHFKDVNRSLREKEKSQT